jgi:intracellular sulfur oxidation DsrE/DsrF family protein
MSTPRRSFLGRLSALLAIGAAPATLAAATAAATAEAPDGAASGDAAYWPDERWLEMLAQREHRMIIESGIIADALVLRRGLNFIDVLNQDYSIPDGRVGLAIGVHTAALSFILNDAMWAKHALGERFGVKNAQGVAATANPYRAGAPFAVESLGKRGVVFLACNRALRRISGELAGAGGNAAAVHAELVANVLPECTVTPAMVVALSRAQSKGVPYMAVA